MPTNMLSDMCQVVHGARLLASEDLGAMSLSLLRDVVRRRNRRLPNLREMATYLNGSMEGDFRRESVEVSNTWTRLRLAMEQLQSKINIEWSKAGEDEISLNLNNTPLSAGEVERALKDADRNFYRERLLAKPDQGKVFQVTSATQMRVAKWGREGLVMATNGA